MEKRYVSVDVETSGPVPMPYSMLSIGACIVGDSKENFYRELKPISDAYVFEAVRIGSMGLTCLAAVRSANVYDPKSDKFSPEKVLAQLKIHGLAPSEAMREFKAWVLKATNGYTPVFAAAPIAFDAMFVNWYFENYLDDKYRTRDKKGELIKSPFGYSGEDMNSRCRGFFKNNKASLKWFKLQVPDTRRIKHHALEDAMQQEREFSHLLKLEKMVLERKAPVVPVSKL